MFQFLLRLLVNLLKLLGICLPLEIVGWIILFPVCFLSNSYKLPYYLRWYDNADLYVGRDTSTYLKIVDSGTWARYMWLAWKNPLNYFGYKVLGYQVLKDFSQFNLPTKIGDTQGKQSGFLYQQIDTIYEYYYIHKWSATKCFRFRMGWKIGNPASNLQGSRIQWCLVIQFYKDYNGL